MTQQAREAAVTVNDTALAQDLAKNLAHNLDQERANPFAGSSLVPMLVAGIVLSLVGMIAAVLMS